MLALGAIAAIYFSSRPIDFRKSFDGLCGEARDYLGKDPCDGSLFVFYNRRHDCLKMLWWERDGFWIFYKRLEVGTFQIPPADPAATSIHIQQHQLQLILSGVELSTVKMRKRYVKILKLDY